MELETIILERLKVAQNKTIPRIVLENTDVKVVCDEIVNCYLIQLQSWLAAEKKEKDFEVSVKYPANWWEAFKEEYFPVKLKEKFPVKYTTKKDSLHIDMYKVYPELEHDLSKPLYKIIYTREKE